MKTEDEQILQDWIPSGDIVTRFFNYENMIAFAKHYEKLKQGQTYPLGDVSDCSFSDRDIDSAYFIGVFNIGGVDGLLKETQRIKKLGIMPSKFVDALNKNE